MVPHCTRVVLFWLQSSTSNSGCLLYVALVRDSEGHKGQLLDETLLPSCRAVYYAMPPPDGYQADAAPSLAISLTCQVAYFRCSLIGPKSVDVS